MKNNVYIVGCSKKRHHLFEEIIQLIFEGMTKNIITTKAEAKQKLDELARNGNESCQASE